MFEIDQGDYRICSSCNGKFSSFKRGEISYRELVTDLTHPKLKVHFKQFSPDEKVVQEVKQKEQKLHSKVEAQENNPLYDDIHQIAGDLRFIKNLIIFSIICGAVLGIIGVLGLI